MMYSNHLIDPEKYLLESSRIMSEGIEAEHFIEGEGRKFFDAQENHFVELAILALFSEKEDTREKARLEAVGVANMLSSIYMSVQRRKKLADPSTPEGKKLKEAAELSRENLLKKMRSLVSYDKGSK